MCEVCGRTGPPILRGPPNFGWNFFIHCIMYYNRQMLSLWRPRHPQPKHKLHNWKITTLAEPVLVVTQTLAYLRKTLAHGVCHLSMFTWRHIDTPHPREVEPLTVIIHHRDSQKAHPCVNPRLLSYQLLNLAGALQV